MREIFDGHVDTLLRVSSAREFMKGASGHVDAPRCREAGVTDLVAAICAEGERDSDRAMRKGLANWRDLRDCLMPSLHLMLEGAEPLVGMKDPAELLRDLSVVTLTWNHVNSLAGGIEGDTGLTEAGKGWIRRLEESDVLLDVSHLCARSRRELLTFAGGTVIASHSNAAVLHEHVRNLPDDDIREIASRGGLVGVTFVPGFLGEDASIETVVDHVAYIADLSGVESVGFGSDFDGIGRLPQGLQGCQSWPLVLQALSNRGFEDDEIDAVTAGNWRRVMGLSDDRDGSL